MSQTDANIKDFVVPTFHLKGSLFTLTVLQLLEFDLQRFNDQLHGLLEQAPKFFKNAPIVIDLAKLQSDAVVNFKALTQTLRDVGLIPVGIRGGKPSHHTAAITAGLAVLPEAKAETPKRETKQTTTTSVRPPQAPVKQTSKLITQQVRSGQQIYANGGDLIILAPVSPGAEILADGHIHVYGPLRGRALAGVTGDSNARIFCHSLEAELVSIAGHYWVKEDLKTTNERKPIQVFLENEHLKIATL